MEKRMPKWLEVVVAIVTAVLIFWSTSMFAQNIHESTLFTQSRILRTLIKEDAIEILPIIREENKRKATEKFTAALTNAYVSFGMIPYDQGKVFTAVINSLNEDTEVDQFEFEGRDLIVEGKAKNMYSYNGFVTGVSSYAIFEDIEENYVKETRGKVEFSFTCIVATSNGYQGIFIWEED